MPESGSPFPSDSRQEFLTIRISKTAGLAILLTSIVVAALILFGVRERASSQVALASNPLEPPQNAIAAPPPTPNPLGGAGRNSIPSLSADRKLPDPAPSSESQIQNEATDYPAVVSQPEAATQAVTPGPAIQLDPLPSDSAVAQPEPQPEDSELRPADPPDQPAQPSPASPDPPPALPVKATSPTVINGAGATFPYPLYAKWFDVYYRRSPDTQFNYQAVGSAAGVHELLAGVVDFGATDVPTSDEQLSKSKVPILNIPTVLGAIVPVYNIPGVSREVRFTPEALAGIFLGKIVSWRDAAIVEPNPEVNFPDDPVVVIHRADGNAATFIFTDYLSKVSADWQQQVGKGTSVNWPNGLGAKGNEGLFGSIRQTSGSIGYVDMLYAEQNKLAFGSVRNADGNFVKASLHSVTEAAASVGELPPYSGISITNAPGKDAYPIASLTWLLVPQKSQDPAKAQDLAAFLRWMTVAGQPLAENLGYAPLPHKVSAQVLKIIAKLR